MNRSIRVPILTAAHACFALAGCDAPADSADSERQLAVMPAEADTPALPTEVFAQQRALFGALAAGRIEDAASYVAMTFQFSDYRNATPAARAVGADYIPAWRERPGRNYYQFLAAGVPADVVWTGRTMEFVWTTRTVVLVVSHLNERDPVYTEWHLGAGEWKAVRMSVHTPDESLIQVRASRRPE